LEEQRQEGIWLEVIEVRFERGGNQGQCSVRLKGDRADLRPAWWPVAPGALSSKVDSQGAQETYREILNELDKKRLVLVELRCQLDQERHWLRCETVRFQPPEIGGR
jgi:hypothetical protein